MNNLFHISETKLSVLMDPFLADILVNNLISNAIKYTKKEARIEIITNESTLVISNSGGHELIHPEKLFLRLYREDNNTQSTGLGLAIVKKICDNYEFNISYVFKTQQHYFTINF
jgi:hypothetical protein